LQIGELEVKEHLKLSLLSIYYTVIWSQFKYWIGANDIGLQKAGTT
jgi:hypothetical protein